MDYDKYLKKKLIHAKDITKSISESDSEEEFISKIDIVRGQLFDFLDKTINHLGSDGATKEHIFFPLLSPHKSLEQLKEHDHYTTIQKTLGDTGVSFINDCYEVINKKNDILYLNPSSKHRVLDKAIPKTKLKYETFDKNKIECNEEGSLDIAGIKFAPGSRVEIRNCMFSNPDQVVAVKELTFVPEKGFEILVKGKDGKFVRQQARDWLNECIATCDEIHKIWLKHRDTK